MNCSELRRKLLQDPFRNDPDLLQHEGQCPECAQFARKLRAEETRLRSLMQNTPVPAQLSAESASVAPLGRHAIQRRSAWFAAVAGVFMLIGAPLLSIFDESGQRANTALARSVLDHIDQEAAHLKDARAVSERSLDFLFARFGARLRAPLGAVNFAAKCHMRHGTGVHLVISGKAGPITVFLMPGEKLVDPVPVTSARFEGRILPTDWGSIAVVGAPGESFDELGEHLVAAVQWKSG